MGNTAQTGVEDQMDTVVQVAKVLAGEMAKVDETVGAGGALGGEGVGAGIQREVAEVVAELRSGSAA